MSTPRLAADRFPLVGNPLGNAEPDFARIAEENAEYVSTIRPSADAAGSLLCSPQHGLYLATSAYIHATVE